MPITQKNIAAGVPDMTSNQLWRYRRGQQAALADLASGRPGRGHRAADAQAAGASAPAATPPPAAAPGPIPPGLAPNAPGTQAPGTNPTLTSTDASEWNQRWQNSGLAPGISGAGQPSTPPLRNPTTKPAQPAPVPMPMPQKYPVPQTLGPTGIYTPATRGQAAGLRNIIRPF